MLIEYPVREQPGKKSFRQSRLRVRYNFRNKNFQSVLEGIS